MRYSISFSSRFLLPLILVLSACGSSENKTVEEHTKESTGSTELVLPVFSPKAEEIDFKHFILIKELAPAQNAALFGLKPERGVFEMVSVSGPNFIKVAHLVGELNETSASQLFKNLTPQMSDNERTSLLTSYQGYSALYFENYDGSLCEGNDNETQITVRGKLNGAYLKLTFVFSGELSSQGNCKLLIEGLRIEN